MEGQDQNRNLKPNLDAKAPNKTPKSTADFDLELKTSIFDQKYPQVTCSKPFSYLLSTKITLEKSFNCPNRFYINSIGATKNRILKSNMRFWNYKLFFDVGCLIRASNCFRFFYQKSTSVQTSYQNIILLFQHHIILPYLSRNKCKKNVFLNSNFHKKTLFVLNVKMYILILGEYHKRRLFGDF